MSQSYKPTQVKAAPPPLFALPPANVNPQERERVVQLIAGGKSGPALEFAKDIHKRSKSAASEALLLDAYCARIASLAERSLHKEAQDLMNLVRERYPSSADRLREWNAVLAARHGALDGLLAPLRDPALPPEKLAAITAWVRRDATDLGALAECQALPPEHPLRTAAGALHKAFEAVTSGPVADEALELPEVSRHSPLAPWKMLVRAIAAFYRCDEALCEKCLSAIDRDSAPARLAPALRALMGQKQTLSPASTALVNLAGRSRENLHAALIRLDEAFSGGKHAQMLKEIRNAVAACQAAASQSAASQAAACQIEPGLMERLKQHISARAWMAELTVDKVAAAMGSPSLKNANFWRLMARASEEEKGKELAMPRACSMWEEFRKHAIHEGWFPEQGPEVATLYLHMADLLDHASARELAEARKIYGGRDFDGYAEYYRGQPPAIRALMTPRNAYGSPERGPYYLFPRVILERACEADPCAENFQRWLHYIKEDRSGAAELVAERWCAALPQDIPPLLFLMESAEKRSSLQKAFKFMERAERIDGLNPEVRRARLRLLVSMAARHLRRKKARLAELDLNKLEALPQLNQGDRPAFVAALRWVCCQLQGKSGTADHWRSEVARLLGDGVTAHLLFLQVAHWCERSDLDWGPSPPPTIPLFAALGRVCALGDDMGMPVEIPGSFQTQLIKELSAPKVSANAQHLAALGEAAIRDGADRLAYAIAGAGLAQGVESQARFLFLRSRALPWDEERRADCLAAAAELARRHRDASLLNQIGEWRVEEMDLLDRPGSAAATMTTEEIGRVVQREIQERSFPATRFSPRPFGPAYAKGSKECNCPACRAERAGLPLESDGLPREGGGLPPEVQALLEALGPEAAARLLMEMMIGGGKKKPRKRRTYVADEDFPF